MTCPIPYCGYIAINDEETIGHLITSHGMDDVLALLRKGCIYDCDQCREDPEDEE